MKTHSQELRLSSTAVVVLAVAAGSALANDYAMQPSLSEVASDFRVPISVITAVASFTMLGYLLGLVLLLPLVDRVSPRTLISGQMGALAIALALAAVAPNPCVLIACFILVGATTTVAAQCSAVVGRYADPARRAASMGAVSAGISAGILLSRFVGGMLTQWLSWRGALLIFAGCAVIAALCVRPLLPLTTSGGRSAYFTTLRAIPSLLHESAQLRQRTCAGMLWFFAFNLIWVGLAIRLAAPPYRLGAASIGLYSIAGVLGLVVTRIAGRLADRFGSHAVILSGLSIAALSAATLTITLGHPTWTWVTLASFDAGCFAAQVANQASVVAINPLRSGALNAAYLTLYYAAGAIGTAIAGPIVAHEGWEGITIITTIAMILAALINSATHSPSHTFPRRTSSNIRGKNRR